MTVRTSPFHSRLVRATLLSAASVALAACSTSAPTRYYTLSATSATAAPAAKLDGQVAFGPLDVPERLARSSMVVVDAGGGSQLKVLDQYRWSSSFQDELRDALAADTAQRLGAVNVSNGGVDSAKPLWNVRVRVTQFDLQLQGPLYARFSWNVEGIPGSSNTQKGEAAKRSGPDCGWVVARDPQGTGMDAVADAARGVAQELSTLIAQNIRNLAAGNSSCPATS